MIDTDDALRSAIGGVLFNVSNFPKKAQVHLLGQDMGPLREELVDTVLAAGYRHHGCEHPVGPYRLTIRTVEQLDALPCGAVVLDSDECAMQSYGDGQWSGSSREWETRQVGLPAHVLWVPVI